ncbi:MAG: FKBP-type peptidyl-prolyl cis-trans isomerase, partial [Leptospiraceae bacterium]|nr:FKBP-type peptidyl-prolyl cis-trans isomerase [Leptospiraceae bacterium]
MKKMLVLFVLFSVGSMFAEASDLVIKDVKKGTGKEALKGNVVLVHYSGYLTNGTKFDSSVDRGKPFSFVLGTGEVIKGWDKGVAGMREGGKRKLTIPP